MAIIPKDICRRMEAHLLEDDLVKQAKIIDIASLDAVEQQLVVAISLNDTEAEQTPQLASAAVRACHKALITSMADAGGKAVVPKRWARPAPLPVNAAGEVDELALRQSVLMAAAVDDANRTAMAEVKAETLEEKIFRVIASAINVPPNELRLDFSFFENGGDSFSAIQVTGRLMMEGVSLRVPQIVGAEILAELPSKVLSRHPDIPTRASTSTPPEELVHEIKLPDTGPVVSVTPVVGV